jgi:phosphohistidine phosphatase
MLFRHGIPVEPDEWEGSEDNRPLTEKGKKRVRQAAAGLVTLNCKPTHILSSSFVRAYDTARLLRTIVCPFLKIETRDELGVGSTPERIIALLRSLPAESVVICVGHEPLLGEVAGILLCGKPTSSFPLKKAGAALIELSGKVNPGQGLLRWWLQPAQLRALGKATGKAGEAEES